VNGFLEAARYLTIVPLPGHVAAAPSLGRAAPWFPVVGLVLGIGLIAIDLITGLLFPSLLAALLTVTAWKLVTGGLHLDGLADCLDGLAGRDPAHRLAIMRDSRIGAFGAVGLLLFLLLEVAAVAGLPRPGRSQALLAAPVIGRAVPPLLGRLFAPARPDGHGAAFASALSRAPAPVALAIALVVALLALGPLGPVALVVALVGGLALARFLARRLSGITGDVLGASVEVAELAVLLTASAWSHAQP
jgi:adenosylcobinamide-GDP ribazoletransferase